MKTKFTFFKNPNHLIKTIAIWKLNKRIIPGVMGLMMLICSIKTNAQTRLVVPNTDEGSAFIGPFGNAARQLQFIIDDTLLTTLVGKNLTTISFRLPASTTDAWPPNALTMSSFEIYLSNSVEPADRQLDFPANVVGPQTKVRLGSLPIPAGALTVGSNPNQFSFKIPFTSLWKYNGGNLLIEIRHSGTGISSRSVHAASTSSAGYGTLYSALWQSTGAVLQGNFIYVEITAENVLGENSVKIGGNSVVYPNPVKDMLSIKSDKEFTSYSIYNMAGQMLNSEKISGSQPINVARLPTGQFILKLTDKNGNTEVTQFIKK
ncbi:T9SS type A sorting domain-containing protein [Kaistella sp. G5-32]|uniref:T9SS type A sorting domain-containing protein n=1 Tax=Kaistella gelatinilytica TaxID=2787636 RepID=A0ABS0FAL6_9FLAO|nr:T9SS type A sorting domain-containing protein [Kaistella gelatinilytica]MBF8456748.1 T9SS type A sorting domain-containing protein [Kaistella gelatinilytica]